MGRHQPGAARRIAALAGFEQAGVFVAALDPPIGLAGAVEHVLEAGGLLQQAQDARLDLAPGGRHQQTMKLAVGEDPDVEIRPRLRRLHLRIGLRDRRDMGLAHGGQGQREASGFQQDAGEIGGLQLPRAEARHPGAVVGFGQQQPLVLQHAHGLAHGCAADPDFPRHTRLGDDGAGRKLTRHDQAAQMLVHIVAVVARIQGDAGHAGSRARRSGAGWWKEYTLC